MTAGGDVDVGLGTGDKRAGVASKPAADMAGPAENWRVMAEADALRDGGVVLGESNPHRADVMVAEAIRNVVEPRTARDDQQPSTRLVVAPHRTERSASRRSPPTLPVAPRRASHEVPRRLVSVPWFPSSSSSQMPSNNAAPSNNVVAAALHVSFVPSPPTTAAPARRSGHSNSLRDASRPSSVRPASRGRVVVEPRNAWDDQQPSSRRPDEPAAGWSAAGSSGRREDDDAQPDADETRLAKHGERLVRNPKFAPIVRKMVRVPEWQRVREMLRHTHMTEALDVLGDDVPENDITKTLDALHALSLADHKQLASAVEARIGGKAAVASSGDVSPVLRAISGGGDAASEDKPDQISSGASSSRKKDALSFLEQSLSHFSSFVERDNPVAWLRRKRKTRRSVATSKGAPEASSKPKVDASPASSKPVVENEIQEGRELMKDPELMEAQFRGNDLQVELDKQTNHMGVRAYEREIARRTFEKEPAKEQVDITAVIDEDAFKAEGGLRGVLNSEGGLNGFVKREVPVLSQEMGKDKAELEHAERALAKGFEDMGVSGNLDS